MSIQELQVEHSGHTVAVEIDASPFIVYRARLFIDGTPADYRDVLSGEFRLHGAGTSEQGFATQFVVEMKLGFWGTAKRAELHTPNDGGIPLQRVHRGRR